jgi:hypothetical protein
MRIHAGTISSTTIALMNSSCKAAHSS